MSSATEEAEAHGDSPDLPRAGADLENIIQVLLKGPRKTRATT